MNTREIAVILGKVLGKVNYYVIPCDYLNRISLSPHGTYICLNNEPSSKEGEHWIGIHIKATQVTFFCSYGRSYKEYDKRIGKFIDGLRMKVIEKSKMLQSLTSDVCGNYVIYFLYVMKRCNSISHFYAYFSNDRLCNDDFVRQFVKKAKSLCTTCTSHMRISCIQICKSMK